MTTEHAWTTAAPTTTNKRTHGFPQDYDPGGGFDGGNVRLGGAFPVERLRGPREREGQGCADPHQPQPPPRPRQCRGARGRGGTSLRSGRRGTDVHFIPLEDFPPHGPTYYLCTIFSSSLSLVTHVRGHVAGTPPPSPLRCVPSFSRRHKTD